VYTDHALFAIDSGDGESVRVLETFGISVSALAERLSVSLN